MMTSIFLKYTDIPERTDFIENFKFFSEIFNTEMEFSADDEVSIEYAQKCIEHFQNLSPAMLEIICKGAKAYCLDFLDMDIDVYGKDMTIPVNADTPPLEMLKCFRPTDLYVQEPEDLNKIGYQIGCDCDWEIEHGMEIDILDDKVLYLSLFNGYSPWLEYEDDDDENYINRMEA